MRLEITNNQKKYKTRQVRYLIKITSKCTLENEKFYEYLLKNKITPVISVLITDNKEIKSINKEHRNIDKETDVLSFPLIENNNKILKKVYNIDIYKTKNNRYEVNLGDIVISLEKAYHQSMEIGNTFEEEVMFLIVHSTLHLLGYDHINSEDENEMIKRQKLVMKKLKS